MVETRNNKELKLRSHDMIDYSKFQKSLKHLELQFDNYNNSHDRTDLSELDREALAESVIQRFETCYDCLWKILKRYLIEGLGIPEVPNSPKPIFRLGHENKLFSSTLEQWLLYADARIDTSHDYSGEKAEESLKLMGDFIDDAIGLYQTMTGETWE
jgi:nucleotidyltransferase substrate binding protein (TIGR01987 family)